MRRTALFADLVSGMTRRLVHEEQGIALVLALCTMLVLSVSTAVVLAGAAVNHRTSLKSSEEQKAFGLAELGLAYAEGTVYSADSSHQTPPSGTQSLPAQPGGGSGSYVVSVAPDGVTWTMSGTGTVDGISRTVSAKANVPGSTTVTDTGVWNYLYANSTSPHTCSNSWDTIQGGTTVSVPILMRGDLCVTGGAHFTGSQLEVDGKLIVNGGANVGTSTAHLTRLNIAGTPTASACTNGSTSVTPGTGVCDGAHSSIYANSVGTSLSVTPSMPSVDFQQAYNNQLAMSKTGCPANLFDNNTTLDNSRSGSNMMTTMFPVNTPYDCHVGSSEIKWSGGSCSTAGTLTISGQMYFDGSLLLGCGMKIIYSGQATMYFTGSVVVNGGDYLCGIANCTTAWNPDVNGLIIVAGCWANSTGSVLVTTKCINPTSGAHVQFGAYATTDYTIDGGASNMGPVLASTLTIAGGSSTLIPFHTMPPGTPLNSRTTYLPANPPSNWGG